MFRRPKREECGQSRPEPAPNGVTVKGFVAAGDDRGARALFTQRFSIALKKLQNNELTDALSAFQALEAEVPTTWANHIIMLRNRQVTALLKQEQWGEALSVLVDLIAHTENLEEFDRERFPNEIASTFWARCVCLEQLDRLQEASHAIAGLIEEVGSGATDVQREYLAEAHLLSARAARAQSRLVDALAEADAAIATCQRFEQPVVTTTLGDAKRMRQQLLAEIADAI